jgi:GGDEF domain-containing protein
VGRDPLYEYAATNRANIAALQAEMERVRERLHSHSDRLATVGVLGEAVQELREQMPLLARQAARDTVTEYMNRRGATVRANLGLLIATASAGIALGGLIATLILGR